MASQPAADPVRYFISNPGEPWREVRRAEYYGRVTLMRSYPHHWGGCRAAKVCK